MPDSSHSFGWSHICAIFVALSNLYACVITTHELPRGQLLNRVPC